MCAAEVASIDLGSLKAKAEAGDVRAQVALGHAYEEGNGVTQSNELAVKWYRAAAEKGDAEAQNDLGVMYRLGHGVEKNVDEAVFWFRRAAKQGQASAMFNLGTYYYNDQETRADDTLAYAWFSMAEDAGSREGADAVRRVVADMSALKLRDSKLILANILINGADVPPNVERGVSLYLDIAPKFPELWVPLAKLYIFGKQVPHDYTRAEKYCTAAAEAKVTAGMVCLAYLDGTGLLGSAREGDAFDWYKKAAHFGNRMSWYALGVMTLNGWGTTKNVEEAYKWLFLAKNAGITNARTPFEEAEKVIDPKKAAKLQQKAWAESRLMLMNYTRAELRSGTEEELEFNVVISGPARQAN